MRVEQHFHAKTSFGKDQNYYLPVQTFMDRSVEESLLVQSLGSKKVLKIVRAELIHRKEEMQRSIHKKRAQDKKSTKRLK